VVEDVDGDSGEKFRRLIFLNNKYLIQSEAKLVAGECKTNLFNSLLSSKKIFKCNWLYNEFCGLPKEISYDVCPLAQVVN